jgi:hypothetical protein
MPCRAREHIPAFLIIHEPDSTRIDDFKRLPIPIRHSADTVARHAGLFVDNGDATARNAVEERALPNVRAAHNGKDVVCRLHKTASAAFMPPVHLSELAMNPPAVISAPAAFLLASNYLRG